MEETPHLKGIPAKRMNKVVAHYKQDSVPVQICVLDVSILTCFCTSVFTVLY